MIRVTILFVKEDKWSAKRLAASLEAFHFPSAHKDTIQIIQPLIPVEDYSKAGFSLPEDSVILAVASRKSAASKAFNDALQTFIQQTNKLVLPFIIDGIPHSDIPQEECFCPVLRKQQQDEYYAANVQEDGFGNALQRSISTISGIQLEILLQSRRKRRKRRRAVIAALMLLFVGYLILDTWYYNHTDQYYETYTYCNGMPTGIHRLQAWELFGMERYYRFEKSGSGLFGVVREGEQDTTLCQDGFSGICDPKEILIFTDYYDNWLDSLIYVDDAGQIIAVANYSAQNTCIDYSLDTDGIEPYRIAPNGIKSDFSRCILTYRQDGSVEHVKFQMIPPSDEDCQQIEFEDNGYE